MKNQIKLFLAIFFTTFILSCKKGDEVNPTQGNPSIIGKWTFAAIGIKSDAKIIEATAAEIKKIDADEADKIDDTAIELKADGTVISTSDEGVEKGKYVYDNNKKTLTITSDTEKDAADKAQITIYDVLNITNNELLMGSIKSSKKDKDGEFIFANDEEGFLVYLSALAIFTIKGLDPDKEIKNYKSIQLTVKLKK
jgi:hypothetical protein